MDVQMEDQTSEMDRNNSELDFVNLTILKEFSNIVNLVKNEDFLETVPKAKAKRIKWIPMFNCLKQGILDEMIQELSAMWQYENMHEKIETLEKQREKFADTDKILWRPQLGDVQAQLKASDVGNLLKQKELLETLAKQYENRVNRLKQSVSAKRAYLKALQLDIQKYQKINEEIVLKLNKKIDSHQNLTSIELPMKLNFHGMNWKEKDLETDG